MMSKASRPFRLFRMFSPSRPSRLGPVLEGAALAGLGLFLAALIVRKTYWMYLNPAYLPLSAAAAAVLVLLGGFSLVRSIARTSPLRPVRPLRLVVFAAFLVVCWSGAGESLYAPGGRSLSFAGSETPTGGPDDPAGERDAEPSRLALDGKDYVKINPGELIGLCARPSGPDLGKGYVVRGIVVKGDSLARLGEFGLVRIAIQCCFADAVAMVVRVKGELPAEAKGGGWVQVFGHLAKEPIDDEIKQLQIRGVFSTLLEPAYVLVADKVAPVQLSDEEAAAATYLFEMRDKEPFAY